MKPSLWHSFPVLFTVFLDFLGFGLVFLIFTPLFLDSALLFEASTSLSTRGLWLGIYIAAYFIAQFFFSPILGALSDRFGRKPTLIWSLLVAAISYLLAAVAIIWGNLFLVLLSRILVGAASGNYTVAQSSIADMSEPKDRSKNFALISMCAGLGYVIGPVIGQELLRFQLLPCQGCAFTTPFLVAGALSLLNILLVIFIYQETLKERRQTPLTFFKGAQELYQGLFISPLRLLFLSIFFFTFGWGFFIEFLPILLLHGYSLDLEGSSLLLASFGVLVALCQGVLVRPLLGRFAPLTLMRPGMFTLGVVLCIGVLSHSLLLFLCLSLPLVFAEALVYPSCATLVSLHSPAQQQGEMLGINLSVQAAAMAISPFFAGPFVANAPFMTLWFSGLSILLGWVVLLFWRPFTLLVKKEKSPTLKG